MQSAMTSTSLRRRHLRAVIACAALAALASCDLVPARRCTRDTDCGQAATCDTTRSVCVSPAVEIVSPAPGSHVGANVNVQARIGFEAAAEIATLTFQTNRQETVVLSRGGSGLYSGTWQPTTAGPRTAKIFVPDGVSSPEFQLTVDLTPPTFVVTVGQPTRTASSQFTVSDENRWRRDEFAVVEIAAEDTIDPVTVQYSLQPVVDGVVGTATTLRPISGDAGERYVARIEVDLSEPEFLGARGAMTLNVTGRDRAGNQGTGTGSIPVTRFKWSWAAPFAGRQLEPAIGTDGTVYTAMEDGGYGQIYVLSPEGEATEVPSNGMVGGMLISGHPEDPLGGVYFTANVGANGVANPDAGFLKVLRPTALAVDSVCGPYASGMHPQLAVMLGAEGSGGLQPSVAFAAREGGGLLVAARIDAGFTCTTKPITFNPRPDTDWGADFFALYASQSSSVTRFTLTPSTWAPPTSGWPSANTVFSNIAPSAPDVFGTGTLSSSGGLFVLSDTGSVRSSSVTGSSLARPAAYDLESRAFFGDGAGVLVRTDRDDQKLTVAVDAGTAPVIGDDGTVYAIEPTGRLVALTKDLQPLWALADAGYQPSSMLLDCARRSDGSVDPTRPGVLYVPAKHGLTAFVADSHGLEPDALFPRARHDNQNTAQSVTGIPNCR